jgi:hypothetical protein
MFGIILKVWFFHGGCGPKLLLLFNFFFFFLKELLNNRNKET